MLLCLFYNVLYVLTGSLSVFPKGYSLFSNLLIYAHMKTYLADEDGFNGTGSLFASTMIAGMTDNLK